MRKFEYSSRKKRYKLESSIAIKSIEDSNLCDSRLEIFIPQSKAKKKKIQIFSPKSL